MEYDNSTLLPEFLDPAANMSVNTILNWWNALDKLYLRHNTLWTVVLVIAYSLIFIVGAIGNSTVILVMIFRPQMRTVTNLFIMNLAVADWFVSVFCVPGTLVSNVFTPWILDSFMCKGVAYVQGVSVCASAYSLAAISFDRCRAIYRPMGRPRGLSKSQALVTIVLIWVVALLITSPWLLIFNTINSDNDGLFYCVETWEDQNSGKFYFLVVNLFCCYVLPLVFISVSNVVIWCHVRNRKVPQEQASSEDIKRLHRRTRHGVRKMLGIVTAAFLISWLPLYILVTWLKFFHVNDEAGNILEILMPFAQWLGSWNSCINPVLYAFLNTKFREMFKSLLPSWAKCAGVGLKNVRSNVLQATACKTTCAKVVKTNDRTNACLERTSAVYSGFVNNNRLGNRNTQAVFLGSLKRAKQDTNGSVLQNPTNFIVTSPVKSFIHSFSSGNDSSDQNSNIVAKSIIIASVNPRNASVSADV